MRETWLWCCFLSKLRVMSSFVFTFMNFVCFFSNKETQSRTKEHNLSARRAFRFPRLGLPVSKAELNVRCGSDYKENVSLPMLSMEAVDVESFRGSFFVVGEKAWKLRTKWKPDSFNAMWRGWELFEQKVELKYWVDGKTFFPLQVFSAANLHIRAFELCG